MMGLLFFLVTAGLAAGTVFLVVHTLRRWVSFVTFPPVLAGLFAFAFYGGLALLTEQMLQLQVFAGAGFLRGYMFGSVLGGCLGLFIAIKISIRTATKLLV